jgi:hypothetical protein
MVRLFKNFIPKIILLVVSTIICFLILEMYFRFTELKYSDSNLKVFKSIYPDSPNSIYEFKSNFKGTVKRPDFNMTIETGEHGFRLPAPNKIDDIELLVMGDSFTLGWGVQGNERYGYLFGQQTGLKTLVASYPNGITTLHYYKFFLLNKSFQPSHIIVGSYLGNDFYLDINETVILNNEPFDMALPYRWIDRHGRLRSKGVLKSEFLENLNKNSFFFKKLINYFINTKNWGLFLVQDKLRMISHISKKFDKGGPTPQAELAMDYLVRLEKECKARNPECKLYTLLIPEAHYVEDYNPSWSKHVKAVKERFENGKSTALSYVLDGCEKRKLNCLNPTAALRKAEAGGTPMHFENDKHWSPAGNAVATSFLCRKIEGLTCNQND